MATIYDGVRVFDATDGLDALAAKMNDYQDKLILGLEARVIPIPIQLAYHDPNEVTWRYIETDVANPPYWENPGATVGEILLLPIPYLPAATLITDIAVVYTGSSGGAEGGSIQLWEQPIDAVPSPGGVPAAGAVDIAGANPWALAGVVTFANTGAIVFEAVSAAAYSIAFASSTTGAGAALKVYSAYYIAQFHKGT